MKIFNFCLLHDYKETEGLSIGGGVFLKKRKCKNCNKQEVYGGGGYMDVSYWIDLNEFLEVNKQFK